MVISISIVTEEQYHTRPVLIYAKCGKKDGEICWRALDMLQKVWDRDFKEVYGDLTTIYTDFDAIRVRKLFAKLRSKPIADEDPLYT